MSLLERIAPHHLPYSPFSILITWPHVSHYTQEKEHHPALVCLEMKEKKKSLKKNKTKKVMAVPIRDTASISHELSARSRKKKDPL